MSGGWGKCDGNVVLGIYCYWHLCSFVTYAAYSSVYEALKDEINGMDFTISSVGDIVCLFKMPFGSCMRSGCVLVSGVLNCVDLFLA
jgi:hypothetical protein